MTNELRELYKKKVDALKIQAREQSNPKMSSEFNWYEGAKSEAAKQYHQQNSEVTKVDLEELRKEFYECIQYQKVDFNPTSIFDFFLPYIKNKNEWIKIVPTKPIDLDSSLLLFDGFQTVIGWYDGQDFHTKNGLFLPTHFKYLIPPIVI